MGIPVETNTNRFTQRLFSPLPERYDKLAELLSMGQNGRWRRVMIDHIAPSKPGLILDVATGTAGVACELARRTEAQIVGIDLTVDMLQQGHRAVKAQDMNERISLLAGRAEQLPFADATFDALTFTYLLRYVDDPQATLHELARMLRPGGAISSLEFLTPRSHFWRFWWWGYTRLLLPIGGLLTGGRAWFDVGRFLGPNITNHYRRYSVEWTVDAWRRAGLVDVGYRRMSLGGGLVMWGRRADG